MKVCPVCGFDPEAPKTKHQRDVEALEEWTFIREAENEKRRRNRRYLTHRQILQLLIRLGYHKNPS